MNRDSILKIIVGVVLIVMIIYAFSGGQSEEDYVETIREYRDEQDVFMKSDEESPFIVHETEYHGLSYFEPDISFKIKARFTPIEKKEIRTLATSDGKEKQYLEYGVAEFDIDGKAQQLIILENVEKEILFLAFGDETSAEETYGGGRYLEVTHSGGKSILLDFNKSYNPYCAYTDGYSCPFPPKENLLEVAITAGEKNYNSTH